MKDPSCYRHVLVEDLKHYLKRKDYLDGFTTIEQAYIRHNIGAIGSEDITKELAKLQAKIHEVTHFELTEMIYQKQLEMGDIYIITDYQTIYSSFKQNSNKKLITWGLEINPSKIYKLVCICIGADKLLPQVYVIEGNTLKQWVVWYDPLYNIHDDGIRDKGTIYYLQDENGNEANYDFKNIRFDVGDELYYTFTDSKGNECSKDFYFNDLREGYDIIIKHPITNLVCHDSHVLIEDKIVDANHKSMKQIIDRDDIYYLDYLDIETLTHQFYAIAKNTHIVA